MTEDRGMYSSDWRVMGEYPPRVAPTGYWMSVQRNGRRPSSRHCLYQRMTHRCWSGSGRVGSSVASVRMRGYVAEASATAYTTTAAKIGRQPGQEGGLGATPGGGALWGSSRRLTWA